MALARTRPVLARIAAFALLSTATSATIATSSPPLPSPIDTDAMERSAPSANLDETRSTTTGLAERPRSATWTHPMPSCNCAGWDHSMCADSDEAECRGLCCSSHRRQSAEFHHRCPIGSFLDDDAHDQLRTRLRGWQHGRLHAYGWHPTGSGGRRFESSGVATWCSAGVPKPPRCLSDWRATGGDDIPHSTWPSGRVAQPLRSVHGGQVEFIHDGKVCSPSRPPQAPPLPSLLVPFARLAPFRAPAPASHAPRPY